MTSLYRDKAACTRMTQADYVHVYREGGGSVTAKGWLIDCKKQLTDSHISYNPARSTTAEPPCLSF